MKTTILIHEWVTGGGYGGLPLPQSWAQEGEAMRRALARDFASIRSLPTNVLMTLDDRFPDEPGPWETIRDDPQARSTRLMIAMARADFALVIAPETNGNLWNWAMLLKQEGFHSLGSSPEAIELTGDKYRFGCHLRDRGIPTPKVHRSGSLTQPPTAFAYPAVLKPNDGAGTLDTYLIESADSLLELQEEIAGETLLQEYVEGEPLSASYLVDGAGVAHKIAVGMQRMVIRDIRFEYLGGEIPCRQFKYLGGEMPYRQAVDEEPLEAAIAAIPGLRGFVGVDFIWDRRIGATTVIEINPRPTTSCVGLCRILPPGLLAQAWLAACGDPSFHTSEIFDRLANELATQSPISFAADGTILTKLGEVG